jgi:nucleotide-binding universal stress UspA family protein
VPRLLNDAKTLISRLAPFVPFPCPMGDRAVASFESEVPWMAPLVRHVLVPLDGSRLAASVLPWAVAVAEAFNARITLLRVLERPAAAACTGHHHDAVEWELRRTEARRWLAAIERDVSVRHVASSIEVVDGRPAERIVTFAATHDADLVALSTHGEGGLTGWPLSSTALMVVARTRASLLVVPAHGATGQRIGDVRLRRILLPLDCSPRAECVLPLTAALARAHGAELVLAHVVPEPEMPRRLAPSAEDLAIASQLTARNRAEGERYLRELGEQLMTEGLRVMTRIVVSPRRAHAIWTIAEESAADLVVLSAHGRTADARERCGSVAGGLIAESRRPIMILQDLATGREPTPAEEAARGRPGH